MIQVNDINRIKLIPGTWLKFYWHHESCFPKINHLFRRAVYYAVVLTKYWERKNQSVNRNLSFAMVISWTSIWQAWLYVSTIIRRKKCFFWSHCTRIETIRSAYSISTHASTTSNYVYVCMEYGVWTCLHSVRLPMRSLFFFLGAYSDALILVAWSNYIHTSMVITTRTQIDSRLIRLTSLLQFHTGAQMNGIVFSLVFSNSLFLSTSMRFKLFRDFLLR